MTATLIAPSSSAVTIRRSTTVRALWLLGGLALIAVLSAASIAFGVRLVSFDEIVSALTGSGDGIAEAAVQKRIPRTVLAILVGAALAIAGTAMQAVTRNPIADPGILGVTHGASLAIVVGIAFVGINHPYAYMAFAVVGAAFAAIFVYAVGSLGRGGATPLKLALAGAATSAAFGSLISAIMMPRVDLLQSYQFWQIGGVGGADWPKITLILPVLIAGALICVSCARGMNSLALGDDLAAGLGERVARTRLIAAVGAVVLTGVATSIAGPIGFVGLVVPHLCRLLIGTDHRWLVPFSAITGAALLLGADVIGRVIARPGEIQVGIVTALIGAPFFIWVVRRQKIREL